MSEFGEEEKSRQLLMKSMSPEGARTLEGTYMCQVKDGENTVNRTIRVYMHGELFIHTQLYNYDLQCITIHELVSSMIIVYNYCLLSVKHSFLTHIG